VTGTSALFSPYADRLVSTLRWLLLGGISPRSHTHSPIFSPFPKPSSQEEGGLGHSITDAAQLLLSFLRRFGEGFDYNRTAVSVGAGGLVSKRSVAARQDRLSVMDPLTGVTLEKSATCSAGFCLAVSKAWPSWFCCR